jgi:glycosyltransferase 2 family protein
VAAADYREDELEGDAKRIAEAPTPHVRTLRAAVVALGTAVTLALLYLTLRGVDAGAAWDAARTANGWWVIPAAGALAAALAMRIERWRSLFRASSRPPFGATTTAFFVGLFFNNIMPLRAGEALRVVVLSRKAHVAAAEVAATVALERVLDVLALLLLLFAAAPWLPHLPWLKAAAVLAVAVLTGTAVAVYVVVRFGDRALLRILAPLRAAPFVTEAQTVSVAKAIVRGLEALRSPATAAIAATWTLASWLMLALSAWLLTLAFHLRLPVLAGLLVVVATNLGQVIPSSPGAIGVFEAAALLAVTTYGVARATGLSYAVALHSLNFLPYLLAGVIALRFAGGRRALEPESDEQ